MTNKSKIRKLITLVVVLIAVIAAYLVVVKINKEKQEKDLIASTSEELNSISINSIDTDKIASFSYLYDGVEYEFYKENDIWYCSNDTSKELDQDILTELIGNFSNVTASRVVEDAATNLTQYGLDNPTNTIKVTDTDGNTTIYYIGNLNNVTNSYYIKTEGNNTVYLISSFPSVFSKSLDELVKTEETTDAKTEETTDATTEETTDATTDSITAD